MPPRLPNWQDLMWRAIHSRLETPFAWGSHDCVRFALFVHGEMTGFDWAAEIERRGLTWATAFEAARLVGEAGLQPLIENAFGPAIPWAWCGQGDLVLIKIGDRETLCINDGAQLLGPGPMRLERVPARYAIVGWRT